jgi:hypothetical protein
VRVGKLRKRVEYTLQLVGCKANPRIAHIDVDDAFLRCHRNRDASTVGRKLRRILEQVREHLRQTNRICLDEERNISEVYRYVVPPAVVRLAPLGVDDLGDKRSEIDQLFLELQLPTSDSRRIQEIIHQAGHMTALPRDDVKRAFDRGVTSNPLLQHGRGGRNRRKRVPQFMFVASKCLFVVHSVRAVRAVPTLDVSASMGAKADEFVRLHREG